MPIRGCWMGRIVYCSPESTRCWNDSTNRLDFNRSNVFELFVGCFALHFGDVLSNNTQQTISFKMAPKVFAWPRSFKLNVPRIYKSWCLFCVSKVVALVCQPHFSTQMFHEQGRKVASAAECWISCGRGWWGGFQVFLDDSLFLGDGFDCCWQFVKPFYFAAFEKGVK